MISPRWMKVMRDAWLHRARTMSVVLAIAVGLAGAGTILDTWSLLRRVTREEYLATNPASATLKLDSADDSLLAAVRAMPAVRDAQARRTVVAGAQRDGAWGPALLYASPSLSAQRIGRLVPDQGQWPPADGAFVIESSSLAYAKAAIGDTISLRVGDGDPVRLPITGVVRDAGLAPGWMDHVVYGFVTPATLAQLGAPSSSNELQIVVSDPSLDRQGIRDVARAARALAMRMGHRVLSVDVPVPGRHVHADQMDSLLMTMGAFGMLALVMSALLVVNLIMATLAGQLREIGVMKAIGARPGQLAAMYFAYAVGVGALASAMAIPLAAWIGHAYARFAATLLNFDVTGYAIPTYAIVLQLAAGLLLPVLAAAIPVIRGSRIPVADALRNTGLAGGATAPWLDRIRGPRRPFLLSLRNAFRRRWRMALTLVTLSSGGAAFLGALDLREAIRASVGTLYGDVLRFDMAVRFATPQLADSGASIASRVAGVERVEAVADARATRADADAIESPIPIAALPADARLIVEPMARGRWLDSGTAPEIVVNTRLLDAQPTFDLGHRVNLIIGGRRSAWTVVGIAQSSLPTPASFVRREALARATGDARASALLIRASARERVQQADVLQRVRSALEASRIDVESSQLTAASRSSLEDHLVMVSDFLLLMAQLTLVVGALGLASTMSLAVQERTREIGVLRAIGATPRAIKTLVQMEGLTIALLSWALAIPLSLAVSVLLERAFGRILFSVTPTGLPHGGAVLIWLAVDAIVSLLACAWPAARATRIPTVAALAYE